MGIVRLKIKKLDITFVGKYRYSKKQKEDIVARHTTWRDWRVGIWFKRNKVVGSKDFKNPSKWKNNLVNSYMLGLDLLIFTCWINWSIGSMKLKLNNNEKT